VNAEIKRIAELDRVIHEPARLMLVAILSEVEEVDFLYLLRETGMSKGNLSSHLSRLADAGYVEVTKTYRGKIQMTLCRLTPEGRAAFEEYRAALKSSLEAIAAAPTVIAPRAEITTALAY
jgi:DNA-binding transcriptional ArsR family regulator